MWAKCVSLKCTRWAYCCPYSVCFVSEACPRERVRSLWQAVESAASASVDCGTDGTRLGLMKGSASMDDAGGGENSLSDEECSLLVVLLSDWGSSCFTFNSLSVLRELSITVLHVYKDQKHCLIVIVPMPM